MALQVLEIVRRPDRIDRAACDRAHIGHRADDVRSDGRIQVEPDLAPFGSLEMGVQLLPQRITATDIQDDLSQGRALVRRDGASAVL